MNKKVCIYCRVAQDDQVKLNSQIESLKIFSKQKNLEVVKVISEFGSGLNFERKGLDELTELSKSKQVDMILVRDVTRIGRDYIKMFEFIDKIKKHIEFKTLDAFDISNDEWQGMSSVLKEFFSHMKKEQIAS